MKVYLDDERTTRHGWHRVYWPGEAIELLKAGSVPKKRHETTRPL